MIERNRINLTNTFTQFTLTELPWGPDEIAFSACRTTYTDRGNVYVLQTGTHLVPNAPHCLPLLAFLAGFFRLAEVGHIRRYFNFFEIMRFRFFFVSMMERNSTLKPRLDTCANDHSILSWTQNQRFLQGKKIFYEFTYRELCCSPSEASKNCWRF